jgi:threonine dehydratase
MARTELTMRDIFLARARIAPVVRRTPLVPSQVLSERTGVSVYLKLENLQETGSFKLRGATNKVLSLTPEQQKRGIIAVSTGNHGRAVSYVARRLGLKAVICLSEHVPRNKIDALQQLGAEVVVHGDSFRTSED